MTTLNGDEAIAWMRAKGTNVPGSCLNTCWQAYGSHPSIGAHAGQFPDAIDGWNYAMKRHPGDMSPPAGYPVWFGVSPTRTDSDAGAGDVVISLGGGQVIATDANGIGGRIGVTTIAARAARIQRPYLGWTEDFLGYDVTTTSTASSGATPLEDDMFEDRDRNTLNQIANALFSGGPSMQDHGRSISASLAALDTELDTVRATVVQPVQRVVNGKTVQIAQIQDNADTNTMLRQIVAEWAALQSVLATIDAGHGGDTAAIEAAAKAGATEALATLKLEAVPAAPAS